MHQSDTYVLCIWLKSGLNGKISYCDLLLVHNTDTIGWSVQINMKKNLMHIRRFKGQSPFLCPLQLKIMTFETTFEGKYVKNNP